MAVRRAGRAGSSIGARVVVLVAAMAVLATTVAGVASVGQAEPAAAVVVAPNDWRGEFNLLRAIGGVAPITEVPAWSAAAAAHSRWMVYNDTISHGEMPGTPWYSEAGDLAGQRSNLTISTAQNSDIGAVDGLMSVPFHGIGIIDPRLTRSGFGAFYDPADSGVRYGATLDVISDFYDPPAETPTVAYPVVWPASRSTLHLRSYGGSEHPDPMTSCPGYPGYGAGVPLYAQFAADTATTTSVILQRVGDGALLGLCWFDEATYANPDSADQQLGRAVLNSRNAVVAMPRYPLEVGQQYRFTVVRGGVTARSTFTVGTEGSPPPVNPFGAFEQVTSPAKGQLRVVGWAGDLSVGTNPVAVHLTVDGVTTSLGDAALARADVGAVWPELGSGHGFDATVAAEPGSRSVCVTAINEGPGVNTLLECKTVWVPDPASPFVDLLSSHPFFADIVWLRDAGIADGYADQTFRMAAPVSRQAMARYLYRAAGSPIVSYPNPGFADVPVGHAFATEIAWMASTGLANGYPDGGFHPTAPVSRQAAAAFLWRMAGEPAPAVDAPTFTDVGPTHPFRAPVSWLAQNGVTEGYPDGGFHPTASVSRQAMAAFLHRWSDLP